MRCAVFGALIGEIRFAADSPVEGKEFEPSVFFMKESVRADEGKRLAIKWGNLVGVVSQLMAT